jgi:RNA polymerase sigma factor (sigma-70 family)
MLMWLHALARKLSPGRSLPTGHGAERRRPARLRLEGLEDRTLLAPAIFVPPALAALAPAVQVAVIASDQIEIRWTDPISGAPEEGATKVFGRPALEKLLEDIHNLAPPRSLSPPDVASVALWLRAGGASGLYGKPVSSVPGQGAGGTEGEGLAFSADPGNPLARSSSAERVAPSDRSLVQPGTDPNLAGAAPTRPVDALPVSQVRQTPGESPADLPEALDGLADLTAPVVQSLVPGLPQGQPTPHSSEPTGSNPSATPAPSLPAIQAGNPAAPTGIERMQSDLPDGSLLKRFVEDREQSAFTALVARYEALVLGICERVLGDWHAALDAFQATFLVLARKATMLSREGSLAGWLWKVAYRLALRLRAALARQRRTDRETVTRRQAPEASPFPADLEKQEMLEALKEELPRLPEKYRVPLALCYFDGHTHAEAARAMGLPRGSMAKRIGQGLRCLRQRLRHRGFLD